MGTLLWRLRQWFKHTIYIQTQGGEKMNMKKLMFAAILLAALLVSIPSVFACSSNPGKVGTITNPNGPVNIDKVTTHLHFSASTWSLQPFNFNTWSTDAGRRGVE